MKLSLLACFSERGHDLPIIEIPSAVDDLLADVLGGRDDLHSYESLKPATIKRTWLSSLGGSDDTDSEKE